MKRLINELFTKREIMDGEHEKTNERTTKIKSKLDALYQLYLHICLTILDAIKVYFFRNDDVQGDGFWNHQGRIIRGNQRRGLAYRNRLL